MRRLINAAADVCNFITRVITAWRYMRRLHYSAHLAWIKAAR